jgi:MerR family transcriptional regulator, thiopeptide resistance regulator
MVYTGRMFTVKQLSRLAHITPRTLHYYDEIGLFKPSLVGENGYRYYAEDSLLRLQQILLYRELDLPIQEIKKILESSDFEVMNALESHKLLIHQRILHLQRLAHTVDDTLSHLQGKKNMSPKQLFAAFSDEEQDKMEQEAMQLYDPETVKASSAKWKKYSDADKKRIFAEGNAVYADFIQAIPKGPASPEAQACVAGWRKHMDYFWTPDDEQLLGLAEGYNIDPRFKANFDQMHPELAAFVLEAVKVYLKNADPKAL